MRKYLGEDRLVTVVRELTKLHEEVWRGSLKSATQYFESSPKGEVVIVIEGSTHEANISDDQVVKTLREAKDLGLSARDASNQVSKQLGVSRGRAYKLYIDLD